MKYLFALIAALCAIPLAAQTTKEGDGAAKLDKESRELSFLLLVQEKIDHFAAGNFPEGKAKIIEEMRRAPRSCTRRDAARKQAETIFRAEMETFLTREIDRIARSTVGTIDAARRRAIGNTLHSAIGKKMKELFPVAFNEARDQLAAEERKSRIFTAIYPSGKELETFSDADLAQKLLQRFTDPAKQPVMEENLPYIQKNLILPVIAAGRKQQRLQNDLLERLRVPQTLWSAEAAEDFLRRELRAAVKREISEEKEHFIDFPSVEQKIRLRAQNIAFERIRDTFPAMLEPQKYRTLLNDEPQYHANWRSSAERCRDLFLDDLLDKTLKELHAPQEVQKKIHSGDPAVQKLFTDAAHKKFQPLRQEYAERQVKRIWRSFGDWLPRPEETEFFVQQGEKALPSTIADRPETGEIVFDETEKQIASVMRKKFAAEADRLKAQQQAVDAVYRPIAAECRELDRKYRAKETGFFQKFFGLAPDALTLNEIIKVYSQKVEAASSQGLFPSVRQEIEIRARAILQQIRTSAEAEAKDTQKLKPPREVQTFVLLIGGRSDTALSLQLGAWRKNLNDGILPAKAIAEELKRQIGGKDIDAILSIEVANSAITYRRVAELRDQLQELLPEATIQDVYRK